MQVRKDDIIFPSVFSRGLSPQRKGESVPKPGHALATALLKEANRDLTVLIQHSGNTGLEVVAVMRAAFHSIQKADLAPLRMERKRMPEVRDRKVSPGGSGDLCPGSLAERYMKDTVLINNGKAVIHRVTFQEEAYLFLNPFAVSQNESAPDPQQACGTEASSSVVFTIIRHFILHESRG